VLSDASVKKLCPEMFPREMFTRHELQKPLTTHNFQGIKQAEFQKNRARLAIHDMQNEALFMSNSENYMRNSIKNFKAYQTGEIRKTGLLSSMNTGSMNAIKQDFVDAGGDPSFNKRFVHSQRMRTERFIASLDQLKRNEVVDYLKTKITKTSGKILTAEDVKDYLLENTASESAREKIVEIYDQVMMY